MAKQTLLFYNRFNRPPSQGEVIDEEKLVIPDESYTIRQLLDMHTRGIPIGVGSQPVEGFDNPDFDSPDLEEIGRMDLAEKEAIVRATVARVKRLKGRVVSESIAKIEKVPKKEDIEQAEVIPEAEANPDDVTE